MSDISAEKSEEATFKRLEEAADKGQIAYSKELGGALLLLLVLGSLKLGGENAATQLSALFERTFSLQAFRSVNPTNIGFVLADSFGTGITVLLPVLLTVVAASLVAAHMQVGFSMNMERITPDFNKINPIAGFSRLFSMRSVVSVALSVLKCAALVAVCWSALDTLLVDAQFATEAGIGAQASFVAETTLDLGLRTAAFLLALALFDVFWQRFRHAKDLMMTKEEVKEERKQMEGDPKIKARIRQIQRQMARSRMLTDVKTATVVVRNPTHYAVALRYENGKDNAPRVVAKGMDFMALKIIDIATKAGVPVKSEPPLARQLYRSVKVGRTIPEELFRAVAKVLAWVYRKRGARRSAAGVAS
ncbi:MAG: flagellar biosynthesis protein FlhB [Planctomycetes bacterium]|nr:flagellar biosynthesis protein FlhB [Planctomycetota bacterium]